MAGERTNVISWDEFFMRVAIAASLRSKDPNTQVGACIADTNHRILSVGYNGTPSALADADFPWGTSNDPLHDKHSYVIHTEANAILNYRGSLKDMAHATVYVTLFPVPRVREDSFQAGIGESPTLDDSMMAPRTTSSPSMSSTSAATYRPTTDLSAVCSSETEGTVLCLLVSRGKCVGLAGTRYRIAGFRLQSCEVGPTEGPPLASAGDFAWLR